MDCLYILKKWRANERSFPILVLSSRGTWAERVEGIEAGDTQSMDIRLPFEVAAMNRDAVGQPAPFAVLHVLVDANRAINDVDRVNNGVWGTISSHSGLRLENINQAMCRHAMWDTGLDRLEADPRFEVIGDVYDEVWTLVAEDFKDAGKVMEDIMTQPAWWMDKDFFLGAEGYVAKRYRKD